jgi:hypothetical protein
MPVFLFHVRVGFDQVKEKLGFSLRVVPVFKEIHYFAVVAGFVCIPADLVHARLGKHGVWTAESVVPIRYRSGSGRVRVGDCVVIFRDGYRDSTQGVLRNQFY